MLLEATNMIHERYQNTKKLNLSALFIALPGISILFFSTILLLFIIYQVLLIDIEWEAINLNSLTNFTNYFIKANMHCIRNRMEQKNRFAIGKIY